MWEHMIELSNGIVGWGMVVVGVLAPVVGLVGSMGGLVSSFLIIYLLSTRG